MESAGNVLTVALFHFMIRTFATSQSFEHFTKIGLAYEFHYFIFIFVIFYGLVQHTWELLQYCFITG